MGVYKTINELQVAAAATAMVNMVSFGSIEEYDNKATIMYPYINLDVVTATVTNFVSEYVIRIYVCDRNEPYIAYNKAEQILNEFLKSPAIDIQSYQINFFTMNFKDQVNGVWADIRLPQLVTTDCFTDTQWQQWGFILQENGDLIRLETATI